MPVLGPRLVVAGTASGVGKTTVATGLISALVRRGVAVASAKVGPDFIDPGYHAVASGRPARSLDVWLSGQALVPALAAAAGDGAELLVVEGVMGMFDGSGEEGVDGSTAEVARLLDAPVVLVVDVGATSGSVAAVVHGFATFDPRVSVAGVILNRVAGAGHEALCREALAPLGVPVLGALGRDERLAWRERHLGLVPVAEHPDEVGRAVAMVGEAVGATCDLERIVAVARRSPPMVVPPPPAAAPVGRARVAVAAGRAFSFVYPENRLLLAQAGAELVDFDPLTDEQLPAGCDALYAGGGFPEVYGEALGQNRPLLESLRVAVARGLVTWAECGGFLWLCERLEGTELVGALPATARMTDRLHIGYRTARASSASPLGLPGTVLRGHEFHRTAVDPPGEALELRGRFGAGRAGYASPTLFAGYLHQHLAATPELAERFVAAAVARGGDG